MNNSLPLLDQIEPLEYQLQQDSGTLQRMEIIDRLLRYYVFTDVSRAEKLITEQDKLLVGYPAGFPRQEFILSLYLHKALLANMRYAYQDSLEQFQEAIRLVEITGSLHQRIEAYIDYTGTCMNCGDFDQAREYLDKASIMLKKFPLLKLEARIIARQGFLNLYIKDYSQATEDLLEADKMLTALPKEHTPKDLYFLCLIHSGLGNIYEHNDKYDRAIQSYLKVVDMAESMNMRSRMSWNYLNLGNAYLAATDLENAERYFLKVVQNPNDPNPISYASAYANLGYCALKKSKFSASLDLLDKAEMLYREHGPEEWSNFGHIAAWRAQAYDGLEDEEMAKEQFISALEIAKEINDYKLLSATCENIAQFHASRQEWDEAYQYQVLHSAYSDRYIKQLNENRQLELEVKYDAEKKRQEAELLRLQATKLQLKALRAQMNPHFLYNALNSIQNYITSNKGNDAAKYLAKFAKLMRQSLEYSDLEFISLEREIEFLGDYLYINEKLRFEDKLKYIIQVDEEIEEDILGVPTMIVQPYVENAIEHGLRTKKNGLIKLNFSLYDEHSILCVVEDNGIGRKKARENQMQDAQYQNHKSKGTKITEDRLRILHHSDSANNLFVKTIDLVGDTDEPTGTRVEIKIPIVDIHMR
ncbi:MAG: histidine kinase [Saprospiraceae bacterium]|nr:histidine kinase [Saprospiraceae bacterium]